MTGTRIGPYGIAEKLGEGGMGRVYRAHDARLGRDVAIKILPAVLAADPERVARFERDGRWIVYAGMDADHGTYVQPFPGPGRRRQVAPTGHFPVWRQDGKEIVYVDRGEGAVWSIAVAGTDDALRFTEPVRLFGNLRRAPGAVLAVQPLGVSSEGSRFFVAQGVEQPDSDVIHVMIEGIR